MVPYVRLSATAAAAGALLMLSGAFAQSAADDSLVCASPARDWDRIDDSATAGAARAFLRDRVKPECAALATRVRNRIRQIEERERAERAAAPSPAGPEPAGLGAIPPTRDQ